ncbi:MAG: helix-turn-helix domain-containing protein [Chloroflexota bacterium]
MILRERILFTALLDNVGISERELARRAGLSHSTINHLVTGRRTSCLVQTALAITDAFDCPVGLLFMVEHPQEQMIINHHDREIGRGRRSRN